MTERARAIGWSLCFLAGGYLVSLLALRSIPPLALLTGPDGPLWLALVQGVLLLAVFGVFSWLIGARALGLTAGDFGLQPVGRGLRGFGWGFLLGGGLAAVAMALATLLGRAAWRPDGGTPGQWLAAAGATGLVLFPAALAEEVMFRGVPLIALSRAFGRVPAIAVLALLFAVGHLWNPGITGLAAANIAIAGVFLGLAFFAPGGLWTATGAHLGWNLAIAALAAPVSGLPLPMPGIDYVAGEPGWLTGGSFGPEGGALAALCLIGGAALAARRGTRERVA